EQTSLNTYYPTVEWDGVTLIEEEAVTTTTGTRTFMTFGDTKKFTLVQERAMPSESSIPVSVEGDPGDLGFTVAAITDKSLRWKSDGASFFLESEMLTREEMIEVALPMSAGEMK